MSKCKLSPLALGLSLGVIWGLSVLLMGLLAHYLSYGTAFVTAMGVVYGGYEPSIVGAVIGGVFSFTNALVIGALIAWFYNMFANCCCKHSSES